MNRFRSHSTTKTSAFELVHGRRHAGKIALFGEVVLVLHGQGPNTKAGPQWVPGVWLTKTHGDDLHVVATPEGLLKGKAIRRLIQTRGDLRGCSWFRRSPSRSSPGPPTPKPVVERQEKLPEEAIDYDARDVIDYARTHPPSPVSDAGMPEAEETKRSHGGECFSPHKSTKLDVAATGGEKAALDDSNVREPETKVPKTIPEGSLSSSSSRLFALHYAGNIQHVMEVGEVDDEQWEEDIAGYLEPDWVALGDGDGDDDQVDEGRSPEVDPDELAQLDEAAGFEEIARLLEMKVIEEPSVEDLEQAVVLCTRSVMDWRFRNQKWQRRCRYVAREFRAGDKRSAATFAPTSGAGAQLVLVAVAFNGCWHFWTSRIDFCWFPSVRRSLWRSPLGGLT